MKTIDIYRDTVMNNNDIAVCTAFHANRFMLRLRGLLGRPQLTDNQGLLLTPCAQVHTLGMRYSLDIVFLDKTGIVTKCITGLKPNRFAASIKAYHALELRAGYLQECQIKVGDQLNWQKERNK